MAKVTLPVLKAWERIFELLKCINDHPYDRNRFQEAVLELYPGKSPKSVFRGMAVPTLRSLGFIVGYADVIRISANGALIHAARQESKPEGLRALRVVLLEMDNKIGILSYLENKPAIPIQVLIDDWTLKVDISDSRVAHKPEARNRAARERIRDWVNFLALAELLYTSGHLLITEKQFDALLKKFQKASDEYTVTFGRSMGADEKLFFFQDQYYQTVSIRFYS